VTTGGVRRQALQPVELAVLGERIGSRAGTGCERQQRDLPEFGAARATRVLRGPIVVGAGWRGRRARALAHQSCLEQLGLARRSHLKFALEYRAALAILLQCSRNAAQRCVTPHQRAMQVLTQRLESY